jgi:flagellar motility protein MotE (MotC chaperone)
MRRFPSRSFPARTAALAALFGAMLAAGPAAPQGSVDPAIAGDIERFCSNIADAARDRRYSLQKSELETLQADVDQRIAALETKRAEYEEWLTRREDFLRQAESGLVDIYSSMRADAAAERLAALKVELAAAILMKLKPRQAGIILNEMNADSAAALTSIMASAARRQDPA